MQYVDSDDLRSALASNGYSDDIIHSLIDSFGYDPDNSLGHGRRHSADIYED